MVEVAIEDEKTEQPQLTREFLTFWLERFRKGDPADPAYRSKFIEVFISRVYLYDDHMRVVCNFTGEESAAVDYDFVNGIESFDGASEVFDFEALARSAGREAAHQNDCLDRAFVSYYNTSAALFYHEVCEKSICK